MPAPPHESDPEIVKAVFIIRFRYLCLPEWRGTVSASETACKSVPSPTPIVLLNLAGQTFLSWWDRHSCLSRAEVLLHAILRAHSSAAEPHVGSAPRNFFFVGSALSLRIFRAPFRSDRANLSAMIHDDAQTLMPGISADDLTPADAADALALPPAAPRLRRADHAQGLLLPRAREGIVPAAHLLRPRLARGGRWDAPAFLAGLAA